MIRVGEVASGMRCRWKSGSRLSWMMREAVEDFRKSRGRLNLGGKKVILAAV